MMTIPYTLALGIEKAELDALWPHMTAYARETFADIQARAARYGNRPTDGQRNLIFRFMNEARMAARSSVRPAKIDLTRITAMFARAAESLKAPRVRFLTDTLGEFFVAPAPATGKNAGFLYVKSGGNGYLGKISPDGVFSPSREAPENVLDALVTFAADPAAAALAYGQATSNCCFCALKLEDPVSVELGYGPICAKRWGLPHRHTGVGRFVAEEVA